MYQPNLNIGSAETRLLPIKKAATRIGISYRALLRQTNAGVVPIYRLGRSRRLVSVGEVIAIMKDQLTKESYRD